MSDASTNAQEWVPNVDPCSAKDKESFAYTSTVTRWPAILTQAIDGLYQASNALVYSRIDQSEKISESKSIIEKISGLKHDLGRDRPLTPIPFDSNLNEPSTDLLNSFIEKNKESGNELTWFNSPWLFSECYLYTLLRHFFSRSKHWSSYDPFAKSKLETFQSSGTAIKALAITLEDLISKAEEEKRNGASQEKILEAQKVIWHTMSQSSLWGNATDLSLLTSLSYNDIQKLQTTDSASQEARSKFILTGTSALDESWEKILQGGKEGKGRVDIVLDNSGFELVTDLMMGDWLLSTGHVKEVVFHPKNMPWFVSDVCAPDFRHTFDSLLEADFFTPPNQTNPSSTERVRSISRTRDTQAHPNFDARGEGKPHPAGSRSLQMSEEDFRGRKPSESPSGSRNLQARSDSIEGMKIGSGNHPVGSRSMKGDPAYFQNARNRTISPSRSYVVNSESFSNLSIHDEEEDGDSSRPSLGRNSSIRSGPISRSASTQSPERERRGREKDTPVQHMARRWNNHLESGRFKLSIPLESKLGQSGGEIVDFWTLPVGYANMNLYAPKLLETLKESSLVIFKGDLNYRKLTGDLKWKGTTPFEETLGPLKGKINLISFRTNKADVCVGLKQEVLDQVEKQDKDWRINGKWAVLQFSGKD